MTDGLHQVFDQGHGASLTDCGIELMGTMRDRSSYVSTFEQCEHWHVQ